MISLLQILSEIKITPSNKELKQYLNNPEFVKNFKEMIKNGKIFYSRGEILNNEILSYLEFIYSGISKETIEKLYNLLK